MGDIAPMSPEARERILVELARLAEAGQSASLIDGSETVVLYRDVPTAGGKRGLPTLTDVVVPCPEGYPCLIDLAGLPLDSPLNQLVKGGANCQRVVLADGRQWALASYHPHGNGGGPPWDSTRHGYDTYFSEILSWLARLG